MPDPLKDVAVEKSTNPRVLFWQKELHNAQKRSRKFFKEAERTVKIYEGDTRPENSFNVLYSNTETLLPACYNQLPRPFVDRRFKDADPNGKLAAQALERVLSSLEDSGDAEYEPFTKLMELAVLGALVPGQGVTWFKYDAEFERDDTRGASLPDDADKTQEDAAKDTVGEQVLEVPSEKVKYETICGEDVDYNHILFGPGRQWSNIPWVARYHEMTEQDAVENFGKRTAAKLKYATAAKNSNDEWKSKEKDIDQPQGSVNVAAVWEIWNKDKKEVLFFAPSSPEGFLKEVEDPYGLSGFFPCAPPLIFLLKRSKLVPTPLYTLYEEQAKELNRITTRINRILGALRVRGFYDGTLEGLKQLLDSDDNTLLPVTNAAAMREGQNLQNSIWFMPFEVMVAALQALWQGREEIKDTIYEITGMSDIMRGEGAASAPATMQQIKNQWGTLRLKRLQRYVQEYVRGCLRVMGELAAKHFSLETFAQMTDLDFALPQEVEQAQKTLAMVQQQMMMLQRQAALAAMQAPPPMPGQAPPAAMTPPPGTQTGPVAGASGGAPTAAPAGGPAGGVPIGPSAPQGAPGGDLMGQPGPGAGVPMPPMLQQAQEQAQAVLAKPRWEDVVGLLRDDMQRAYRVDIETNSTIATDSQEDKENISEALSAISQLFQGLVPMVQQGAISMGVVKAMMLTVSRRYQFGREVEDSISQLPDQLPPQPQKGADAGPTPEEQQATQAEAQADMQAAQLKMAMGQREEERQQQEHGFKMAEMQREEQEAQQAHELKMQEIQASLMEVRMKMSVTALQTGAQREQTVQKAAMSREQMQQQREQMALQREQTAMGAAAAMEKTVLGQQTARQQARAARQKPPRGGGNGGGGAPV